MFKKAQNNRPEEVSLEEALSVPMAALEVPPVRRGMTSLSVLDSHKRA